jgi:hypothetical protein
MVPFESIVPETDHGSEVGITGMGDCMFLYEGLDALIVDEMSSDANWKPADKGCSTYAVSALSASSIRVGLYGN